jgi:hypothetical protein
VTRHPASNRPHAPPGRCLGPAGLPTVGESHQLESFVDLERAVWQALKDGDAAADARLLSDDFLGVYSTGFAGKSDHVAQLQGGPAVAWYELSSAHIMVLADDLVLLSYFARFGRAGFQKEAEPQAMYITSIWRRQRGSWLNVFSQDTDCHPARLDR